jgi:hypothetical protein
MKPIEYDAIRERVPELADATDEQIAQLPDYAFSTLRYLLADLKRKGEAILAERELQKAAD